MRTTLSIDDDVLHAAKELAARDKRTVGEVISELARRALNGSPHGTGPPDDDEEYFGFRPLPRRGGIATNELVRRLRDADPYG